MNILLLTICLINFFSPAAKAAGQVFQYDVLMQTLDALLAKQPDTAQEVKEACKGAFEQKIPKEKIEILLSSIATQSSLLSKKEVERIMDIILHYITSSSLSEKEKVGLVRFLYSVYQKKNDEKTEANEQLEINKQVFQIMKSPVDRVKKYEKNRQQMLVLG